MSIAAAVSGGGSLACGGSDALAPSLGMSAHAEHDAGPSARTTETAATPAADGGGTLRTASKPQDAATPPSCDPNLDAGCPAAASGGEPTLPVADAGGIKAPPPPADDAASVPHPFFATAIIDEAPSTPHIGDGDLWPSCWGDDDNLYAAAGDGAGFGVLSSDIITARIEGRPGDSTYRGTALASGSQVSDIWSGINYNRKPTGMLCSNGDLYLAVQDLHVNTFDDAPAATIVRSSDKGMTWVWDHDQPMFSDHVFTTVMFLDFGKNAEHAPKDYVFAYGLDDNWSFQTTALAPPTQLFMARAPRDAIQNRARWEFFTGIDAMGAPTWNADIARKAPVLEDTRRLCTQPLDPTLRFQNMTVVNQGGVVYNAALDRYIFSTWTEYTFEFYEAPAPWGPFTLFYSKDFGVTPWTAAKNGGYATTIPSKFISDDGLTMLVQANAWSETGFDAYGFTLRALHVTPYRQSEPQNQRGPANLANAAGVVPITRALRNAGDTILNDGDIQRGDDSWSGEAKTEDYWGYTWPTALHVNTLRYTTGEESANGGYFEQLTVQVRNGRDWVNVKNLSLSPAYPGDASVPAFTTYTLTFDEVVGDGVRIDGKPGGSQHYTSLAELSAHYE